MVADRRYRTSTRSGGSGGGGGGGKKPPARRPRKRAPRRGGPLMWIAAFFRWIVGTVWAVAWRIGLVGALALGAVVFYFYSQMPPLNDMLDARAKGSVTLLDRDDKVFAWRGETFGQDVTAQSVSPYLHDAVIATEDKRFYHHFGVSPRGIASAIAINLREGRGALEGNGGSTITQQVAKLLCLGVPYDPKTWKSETEYETDCRKGGIWRKVREVPYALALEVKYSKEQILTIYFNRAYLGAGARGFEAASQRYFGISAKTVDPAQGAMLAGLLKAPSYYAPTANLKRAQTRADLILGLMQEQGYITAAQREEGRANPATLSAAAEAQAGGYFADWMMDQAPRFLAKDTTEDVVMRTTLDQRIQTAAETALRDVFTDKLKDGSNAQAAVVVMSADGAVRAMVGGRSPQPPGSFNRATMARRQTGSSFKPFVYAAAMDLGYTPSDFVEDKPLTIQIKGSGPWSPENYTRRYLGLITLTKALEESVNTAAVRIAMAVGLDNVRKVATDFGIQSDLAAGPALALGASESTLLEMTGAYAGILNGGSAVKPFGLIDLHLKGDTAPLMGQEGGIGERVISQRSAQYLTYMMNKVVEEGTGGRAKIPGLELAGKTGTTSGLRDAWFVGFSADYVIGVWMGYDDNSPMKGVTGGGIPAEVWREVMKRTEAGQPAKPLPMLIPEPKLAPTPENLARYGQAENQVATGDPSLADNPYGEGVVNEGPVGAQDNLPDRILNEVLGIFNN